MLRKTVGNDTSDRKVKDLNAQAALILRFGATLNVAAVFA
jgi:hypothetical protein